jgi:thioesterase domain-containing protein
VLSDAWITSVFARFFYAHEPGFADVTPPEFASLEHLLDHCNQDPGRFELARQLPVARIAEFIGLQSRFVDHYTAPVFDGDLLFFEAIQREEEDQLPTTVGWTSLATGAFHHVSVDCSHIFIMQPEALVVIGKVLNEHLRSTRTLA